MVVTGGRKKMSLLLIILFLITSCDKTSEIFLDGDNDITVSFDCGVVNLNSRSMGNREFVVLQTYTLNKEITIFKDSLEIHYKDQIIPFSLEFKGKEMNQSALRINQSSEILLRFYIPGGIEKGDTINLVPDGYLYCDQKKVDVGNVHLTLSE
jgi:hypothetical protein